MTLYDFALLLTLDNSMMRQTIWKEPDWDTGESIGLVGCPQSVAEITPNMVSLCGYTFALPKVHNSRELKHSTAGFWRGPMHVPGVSPVPYAGYAGYEGFYDPLATYFCEMCEMNAQDWHVLCTRHISDMLTDEGRETAFEMWLTARKWAGANPATFEEEMRATQAKCRRIWEAEAV